MAVGNSQRTGRSGRTRLPAERKSLEPDEELVRGRGQADARDRCRDGEHRVQVPRQCKCEGKR